MPTTLERVAAALAIGLEKAKKDVQMYKELLKSHDAVGNQRIVLELALTQSESEVESYTRLIAQQGK
jgi:hypothetical protein